MLSCPSLLCSDTEAQEDTFMERLGRLREHVTSSATTLLEKGKAVVEDISNSKYAVESRYVCTHARTWARTWAQTCLKNFHLFFYVIPRTWLQEQMERVVNKLQELKS
uniref:Uncharacterized protein n=1 Tax=Takifugu rubripes TaxID=31033 RepID=A0A3B5JZX8_TAKRU